MKKYLLIILLFFSISNLQAKDNLVFYIGKAIENNSNVALNFHWKTLQKQIRIEGIASQISKKEADEYYNSRPIGSRIGAWASLQSEELPSRSTLVKRVSELETKFESQNIPRPSHWNGYLVVPNLIEFWQDMPFRLHDRLEFIKDNENWIERKLYP